MIVNHHVGLRLRYGYFDLLRLIHNFYPAVEMKPQEAAGHNACDAIGSPNHRHIILAGENSRMAEPPADLADESAGPGEIRQPGRADHWRHNDVAVFEVNQLIAPLHFRFRDDASARFEHAAAR